MYSKYSHSGTMYICCKCDQSLMVIVYLLSSTPTYPPKIAVIDSFSIAKMEKC